MSVQQNIVFPEVEKMGSLGSGSYNFAANRSHLMGWGILPLYQMRKRKTGPGPDLSTELLIRSNHGAMRGSFWYHKKTWLELAVSSVFNYILFLGAPSPPWGAGVRWEFYLEILPANVLNAAHASFGHCLQVFLTHLGPVFIRLHFDYFLIVSSLKNYVQTSELRPDFYKFIWNLCSRKQQEKWEGHKFVP